VDRTSVAEAADPTPGVAEVDRTSAEADTQVVEVTLEVADTPGEPAVAIQAVAAGTAVVIIADRFPASPQK
jgi:hypothetical protein